MADQPLDIGIARSLPIDPRAINDLLERVERLEKIMIEDKPWQTLAGLVVKVRDIEDRLKQPLVK